jgi:hypothetical protein
LVDAGRRTRVATRIDVAFDGIPLPRTRTCAWLSPRERRRPKDVLERIPRHMSCLHALLDRPGLKDPLDVRLQDASRHFVPRRLSIPLATRPVTVAPWLYPGAAYDISESVTGCRARLLRGASGPVVRWPRVEARLPSAAPGGGLVVGRAHGDDRGEFLLIIDPGAATTGDIVDPLPLEITAFGPGVAPAASSPELPQLDPLWDLPLEPVTGASVLRGEAMPAGYGFSATSRRTVLLNLGRLTGLPDFVL